MGKALQGLQGFFFNLKYKIMVGVKFGGRKKGSPNKTTLEIRNAFQILIENNLCQLQNDLDYLQPFERIKVLIEFSKFILPQIKSVEMAIEVEPARNIINLGRGISPDRQEEIFREEIQRINDELEIKY